ncbi:MAG: alpha/beta fold hydrolase [Myxococcota bacterium]
MEILDVHSVDGAHSSLFVGEGLEASAPLLWLQPAMGVEARWYAPLAEPAARRGLRLVRADLRGHGSSSLRPSRAVDFGFRDIVEFDLPAQLAVLEARFPDAPVLLAGHSLGGLLSLLFGARRPGQVEGVACLAAGSIYHRAWKGGPYPSAGVWVATQSMGLLARAMGWFPGSLVGFGGRESRDLMRDWSRQARTGRFKSKGLDYDVDLRRCRTSCLFLSLEGDKLAPTGAVDDLARRIPSRRAHRIHLSVPDLSRPHFDWVKRGDAILEAVQTWRASRASRARSETTRWA